MKTEKLLVEETSLRCVNVRRTLVVEVPEGLRDHAWLQRIVAEGDQDWGPFPFDPVQGSEFMEPVRLQIIGVTDEPADMPCRVGVAPRYEQEEASNEPF